MTDTGATSVIAMYQQRIGAKPYVPATTYGRPTLGANIPYMAINSLHCIQITLRSVKLG